MTYNFDPERWYEREKAAIENKHSSGQLDAREREQALEELDRRLAEMWNRLDGTYRIPE